LAEEDENQGRDQAAARGPMNPGRQRDQLPGIRLALTKTTDCCPTGATLDFLREGAVLKLRSPRGESDLIFAFRPALPAGHLFTLGGELPYRH